LILSQFLRADGCVLPRTVSGLCHKAQLRLQRLVHQAQRAGLMPELRPDQHTGLPRGDRLKSNYKWKKYNAYFDEDWFMAPDMDYDSIYGQWISSLYWLALLWMALMVFLCSAALNTIFVIVSPLNIFVVIYCLVHLYCLGYNINVMQQCIMS